MEQESVTLAELISTQRRERPGSPAMEQESVTLAQHLQSWVQAQGVPDGAESLRVVFDGAYAYINAVVRGQRSKFVVPFRLHIPPVPVVHAVPPAAAKKKTATRRR